MKALHVVVEGDKDNALSYCRECEREFATSYSLQAHKARVHDKDIIDSDSDDEPAN
jgi:hypothetical protein